MKEQFKFTYIYFSIGLLLQCHTTCAQNNYKSQINAAIRAYVNKEYLKSAQLYSKAFFDSHNRVPVNHRLDAARIWALAGQADSAFYQLNRIAHAGYYDQLENIFADDAFDSLKNDKRWTNLSALLKTNNIRPEAAVKRNYLLIAELAVIEYDDQEYRVQLTAAEQQYGTESNQVMQFNHIVLQQDSINQQKIKAILSKYGWPGINEVGNEAGHTIFLVIQHAPLSMQLKYLSLVKDAAKRGLIAVGDVAIMEDRIAIRQHKKQVYGSQVVQDIKTGKYYVLPLKDPKNVDIRRAAIGLQPFTEYLRQWNIEWDVERYKKELPGIKRLTDQFSY